jgi:hypothetical protein
MAATVWKGYLGFGLVSFPIRLFGVNFAGLRGFTSADHRHDSASEDELRNRRYAWKACDSATSFC